VASCAGIGNDPELYSHADSTPIRWPGMPPMSIQKAFGSKFVVSNRLESPGIQIVDIVMWLFGRRGAGVAPIAPVGNGGSTIDSGPSPCFCQTQLPVSTSVLPYFFLQCKVGFCAGSEASIWRRAR
jgi:hypothetical protein